MLPRRALTLTTALAVILGACSDGDAPATETPSATSTRATTSTPEGTTTATGSATPAVTPRPTAEPVGDVTSTFHIPTAELPLVRFSTSDGATVDLPVEVPPPSEYGTGLGGRTELEGRGMLFYYAGETGGPGFWMRGTHMDIDIAFVAGDGAILSVETMLAGTDDIHHPGRAYLAGIEAPAGWYAEHGIEAGDRVEFLFDPQELLGEG